MMNHIYCSCGRRVDFSSFDPRSWFKKCKCLRGKNKGAVRDNKVYDTKDAPENKEFF